MAKRRNTWDVGESYNSQIRSEIMPPLAEQLKLDKLPMYHEGFNFWRAAVAFFVKNSDLDGADLHDAASDVISKILSPTKTGKPAPIDDYVRRYREQQAAGGAIQPFDRYFNMSIAGRRGKGWNVLRDFSRSREKHRALPIERGRGDLGQGNLVLEESLPQFREPSPFEALRFKEETPKREKALEAKEKALKAVPDYLKGLRAGAEVEQMWEMLQEEERTGKKLTLQAMAGILDSMGIPGPTEYGDWDTNAVFRLRRKVHKIVRDFMEREGVDWESISLGSRVGFRFCLRERY
jgi:hypothetical protein